MIDGYGYPSPSPTPSPSSLPSSVSFLFSLLPLPEEIQADLKAALTGMVHGIFGDDCEMRWSSDYFPFTDPSFELEVLYNGKWLEVLGCGQVHPQVLEHAGLTNHKGWAFGIGLERLAMVLFDIPDIRLFWSQDPRFLSQFKDGEITTFQPFSKYPPCFKDISAWIPDNFHDNDICCVIRDVAGDMVENVDMIDEFTHPKTNKTSRCYRITYRSLERSLTNEEVDELQTTVRERVEKDLGLEIR
jgi:phenylalanyl-tRNA synthetase alpha chain